jgi:hypothetical protein
LFCIGIFLKRFEADCSILQRFAAFCRGRLTLIKLARRDRLRPLLVTEIAIRGGTAVQLHDGARQSRLVDREAARRRRGLDGRGDGVTTI